MPSPDDAASLLSDAFLDQCEGEVQRLAVLHERLRRALAAFEDLLRIGDRLPRSSWVTVPSRSPRRRRRRPGS